MGSNVRKILKDNGKEKQDDGVGKRRSVRPLLLPLYLFCFILLAWYFLYVENADTMYFFQDRGWWNSTRIFWQECTSVPGGFLSWAGAYLTQFFFYPALGCFIFILLLLLIFLLAKWSFSVPTEWSFLLLVPLSCLICSDIQIGYWIYILKDIDYVFFHPLGLFFALLLSVPFWQYLPVGEKAKRWIALVWTVLLPTVFYYPLGIYALLAAVLTFLNFIKKTDTPQRIPANFLFSYFLILIVFLFLVPRLETSGTTLMRPDEAWFYGFHKFELDNLRDYSLETPLYLVLIVPAFFPFVKRLKASLLLSQGLALAVFGLMFCCLSVRNFSDYNFHAELRMQRAVEECRWNDVLKEAAKAREPVTREMVMFRDIALINRGELCSRRYQYNNVSIPPCTVSDSIHIRISDQAADLIYYNYGETVFAIRRAVERAMHYGFSYYTMRMLTQCALVGGEYENARKYLRLLSKTTFQKHWAAVMQGYADSRTLPSDNALFRMPLKLYREGSEVVGTDDKFVELTILKKWMYTLTDDAEAQQVALGCAMVMRDRNCFWAQVQRYYNLNPGKAFPTHVQEAMLFDAYELKTPGVNLSSVKFDENVLRRYRAFAERRQACAAQGMDEDMMGKALRPEFGDTYMWDYCVIREVQTN